MGTVCRKQSQRKERLSWHLPLRPSPLLSPRPSLRLMPTTATATALVATTVATGPTVLTMAMDSTTARGRLRLSPGLIYYGYGYGLSGYYGGYRTYGLGYGYGHGLYYGKREAESEPYYG